MSYRNQINRNRHGYPIVYTDGACSGNGFNGAQAGIGVFWCDGHPDNVSCRLYGHRQTNNRAEIQAAIVAIKKALKNNYRSLDIHTDSQFMINAMQKWIHQWNRNGWRLANGEPVRNKEDWQQLQEYIQLMDNVMFTKVGGHSGHYGNDQADSLAKQAIDD